MRRTIALAFGVVASLGACATQRPTDVSQARASASSPATLPELEPGQVGRVLRCAKVLTMDAEDRVFAPGMIATVDGRIAAVGASLEIPAGYEVVDLGDAWIAPGMIDLHSHIHAGSFGDLNDMVLPVNPEFSSAPAIVPGNKNVRRACAGGVTTLFGIPGSGTSMSGFGVLYKTKQAPFEQAVLANPGGLKVAQDSNPQRDAGDFGAGRGALSWILDEVNEEALEANARGADDDPRLRNLQKVHRRELPVLIHTAGSDGVLNTARMWHTGYGTRSVLSHGCFDAWKTTPAVAAAGMPANNGPRTIDWFSSREGRIIGISAEYLAAGHENLSLNTDSPVVPQEELFLQGAMSSRHGADGYTMLRAVTIHPAIAFGIDDRVGSLEPGKHADIVVWSGVPLDPRSRVELVLIDGRIEYERAKDGQLF